MRAALPPSLISVCLCLFGMVNPGFAQSWGPATSVAPPCGCGPTTIIAPSTIAPQPMFYDAPPPVFYDPGYGYNSMAPAMPRRPCPPWRPCGPGESFGGNRLFKQGYAGADFRPACAQHDACLMSGRCSRYQCDRQFLDNLDAACCCSSRPWLCRLKARKYYLGVRLFGWLY